MVRLSCLAFGVLLLLGRGALAQPPEYAVAIQSGLTPRMSPSTVAAQVRSLVAGNRRATGEGAARVTRVECTDGVALRSGSTHPAGQGAGPIWVVRVAVDGPIGALPQVHTLSYAIDDETGEVLGYGATGRGPIGMDLRKFVPPE